MASVSAKRKSGDMADAYPSVEETTPTNPPTKKMRITRSQKQALIDNLQLEITERARKLRAQYALQAQDLRGRIERRVNRIPVALRKANMGELLDKHNASLRAQLEGSPKKYASPRKASRNVPMTASGRKKAATVSPSPRRVRRHSPTGIYSDKENAPAAGEQLDVLKNPKRRAQPGAAGGTSRVVSQEVRGADYRILSPKSSNSRTYPQSPLRASPEKPQPPVYLSRPMSPLKPSSPLKSTTARPGSSRGVAPSSITRPPSSQSKRPASRIATAGARIVRSPLTRPSTRQAERRGSMSSTSSGATVANASRTTASRKVTAASTASTAAKKAAVAKSQNPSVSAKRSATAPSGARKAMASGTGETTTGGRRALRKRA
ncbi:Borealin N terminal-domain-containing protein [Aspergillus egyptiacus]|nr:Borealin N terminal-domain-containing protein [Aspergillus egyptiacus]